MPEGISMEFKPAPSGSSDGRTIPAMEYDHACLVYENDAGERRVIRGGPERDDSLALFGTIAVQADIPLSESKDKYGDGETPETRHAIKLDLGGRNPKEVWREMTEKATEIGHAGIEYDTVPHISTPQNSNSVVRTVLDAAGIDTGTVLPAEAKDTAYGF
ncbi:MAG: hypothetical protein FD149_2653 [Rhodospirillaceae bacterium]|nr:MAG: hypothetical protein FD149_2653 [Rhodospirillaceae bacterium]